MGEYTKMTSAELEQEYAAVLAHYNDCKGQNLKLNMARGKPSKMQLDAVSDILQTLQTKD